MCWIALVDTRPCDDVFLLLDLIFDIFSTLFFADMPIPAVGKECNLNALPKIELQMQGVERTICPAAKREG